MTMKKKRRETGAKNVMRAATGPGFRRLGRSRPIFCPVTRLSNRHPSRQPSPAAVLVVGETVPGGKSMRRKSVVMSSAKSCTLLTPSGAKA
jgi:hypothetical protein